MKKILILTTVMAMVAGIFYSCTKNEGTKNSPVMNTQTNPQMSKEDIRIMNLIVDFKKKMDFLEANPGIKSGESKSVDSAVWYLEAAANYSYADAGYDSKDYIVDTAIIDVPTTNGEVLLTDIQIAYAQIESILDGQLANIPGEKQLILFDVEKKESKADKVTLKVSSGIGKDVPPTQNFDSYYWGMGYGICDGNPDLSGSSYDATDMIERAANKTIGWNLPAHLYFTEVETVEEIYPNSPGVKISNGQNSWGYDDSRLFGNGNGNIYECIPSEAMSFYHDKLFEIADYYQPSGLSLGRFNLYYDFTPGEFPYCNHAVNISYGEWHVYGNNGN